MSKESLRKRILRLARENPGPLRDALMPLIARDAGLASVDPWVRQEINIPLSGGATARVAALVSDVWAVHKSIDGSEKWSVTHVPSGLAASSRIDSKDRAKAIVEAMGKTEPALKTARSQQDVMQFQATIVDILRDPYEYVSRS